METDVIPRTATRAPVLVAFLCQEIADNILENFTPLTEAELHGDQENQATLTRLSSQSRTTLARLARTCRAFSEPALDILWRRLDTPTPLIRLLLQFGRKSWRDRDVLSKVTPAEWARFQSYAHRVRELYNPGVNRDTHSYDRPFWEGLSKLSNELPLLPKLLRLWSLHLDPTGELIDHPLLSPSLRHVSLRIERPPQRNLAQRLLDLEPQRASITLALERIHAAAPYLEHLELTGTGRVLDEPQPGFLSGVLTFYAIRCLTFDSEFPLSQASLQHLSHLHRLESLTASLDFNDSDDAPDTDIGQFSTLKFLSLCGKQNHLAAFFSHCTLPALRHLSIDFSSPPSSFPPTAPLAFLGRLPTALETLKIKRSPVNNVDGAWVTVAGSAEFLHALPPNSLMDLVKPVLSLHALTCVVLDLDYSHFPPFDDADVRRMLDAWPQLVELRVGRFNKLQRLSTEPAPPPPPQPRSPTAHTLVAIATGCPSLKHLRLPQVDLKKAHHILAQEPAPDMPPHGLKYLRLDPTCDEDRELFNAALLLDRLFPHAELPEGSSEHDEGNWRRLRDYVLAMRTGRAHGSVLKELSPGSIVVMRHGDYNPIEIERIPGFVAVQPSGAGN